MTLKTLIETLSTRLESSEAESRAYEAEIERGRDVFENNRAMGYFDGHAAALREVLEEIEDLIGLESAAPEPAVC